MSLDEMVDLLGDSTVRTANLDVLAKKANKEIAANSNEIRNYKQAYTADIGGALLIYIGVASTILENMYEEASGYAPKLTPEQRQTHEQQLLTFFIQLFRKSSIATHLPTLHILASCSAAIRWDKKRRLTGNDLCDFHHAAAALGYCDVFLTEGPLNLC
jgi:hypothetical protein